MNGDWQVTVQSASTQRDTTVEALEEGANVPSLTPFPGFSQCACTTPRQARKHLSFVLRNPMLSVSLGARYCFFGSSSSSGIFGSLCAIPLWQSIQVRPALNPSAMTFAAVSVCLCGSIAAAE